MSDAMIELNLRARLDAFDFEVDFRSGKKVIGVFGPSGSGKTTLLESVAGLRRDVSGRLRCGGETWLDSGAGKWLGAEWREIGYVPQEHLLFPHWNVRRNLRAGIARARRRGVDVDRVFAEAVRVLGLEALLERRVAELSGGERQRVPYIASAHPPYTKPQTPLQRKRDEPTLPRDNPKIASPAPPPRFPSK